MSHPSACRRFWRGMNDRVWAHTWAKREIASDKSIPRHDVDALKR